MVIAALLTGLLLGGLVVLVAVRPALLERRRRVQEVIELERALATAEARLEQAEETSDERLQTAVKSASLEAYAQTNSALVELAKAKLEGTVKPLEESLRAVGERVQELDRARAKGYGELSRHLTDLGEQTTSLRNALRTPHARGRWGEIQLKRVVEIAGMLPYCDFAEQVTTTSEDGRLRPDLIVRLPGDKQVVVDAKVPLAAYLEAHETTDENARSQHLEDHARQVRDHLQKLAAKSYWQQFADSPEWVVMFLPDEGFFRAAWELDPGLVELGVRSRVHIASPTTLIVLLQAIAHGWQQEKVAEDARVVHALGRELYERMTVTVGTHFAKLGATLDKAITAYNETVGSLERRVLPTARKLGQTTLSDKELPELEPRSTHSVPLQAPEIAPDDRVLLAILAGEADADADAA
jgi:DNA recombination protein RmuC